jgi:hypothetical protein
MTFTRVLFWSGVVFAVATTRASAADPPSFMKDVKPFLTKYCTDCHGAKAAKAGLKLETYADLMKGAKKGPVIVAKRPDQSLLMRTLVGQGKPMPPKNSPNKPIATEIAKVKAWITAGAKDDSSGALLMPQFDRAIALLAADPLEGLSLHRESCPIFE